MSGFRNSASRQTDQTLQETIYPISLLDHKPGDMILKRAQDQNSSVNTDEGLDFSFQLMDLGWIRLGAGKT